MKRISPATVTFGVMAIVLGLVAAYIVKQSLQKPPVVVKPPAPRPAPPPPELVPVTFARNNIPKNCRITAADLFVGYVGKEAKAATGTFKSSALAEGRITTQTIRAGQAIRDEYLLGIGETLPDLADRLPAGHRAVTIDLGGAYTGGKRLEEGDRVDISITVEGTHPDLGEVLTRTLLKNVLVMDAIEGRPLMRGTSHASRQTGANVTVAVLPADANKLLVAERTGDLIATLVSRQDAVADAVAADDAISRRQLLGLKDPPPVKRFTVEKWSGGSMRVLEMSDDRVRESREVTTAAPQIPVKAPPAAAPPIDPSQTSIPSGIVAPVAIPAEAEAPATATAP
ncbi:MAG: Flp pilus assembly protein CpaB [Pirellulaceae bacterium]|nr:Flp pilus assembly protein CpaB [Pirellulaceae bacterium]